MGGFFGVVSREDCVAELYYGTDYHCHLGTRRGGMAVSDGTEFNRIIHDITNAQFRSKFDDDVSAMNGRIGIGVISDYEDQPLLIHSHLGSYAIVTVGVIKNAEELAAKAFKTKSTHFSEMDGGEVNATELIATLINEADSFVEGIKNAQEQVDGSASILLLTHKGIYAARDKYGRTPIIIGKGSNGYAATMETCSFPNLGYNIERELGPDEIVFLTAEGVEQLSPPQDIDQICAFLWVYYGYPASSYDGINVEAARYRCGAALADRDDVEIDYVAGIPDSGTAHALGYADRSGVKYRRPFVKYTPTWPRSFMPQDQKVRDLVAKMKLIPIRELIQGTRMLFCDDSVVRGTQMKDTLQRVWDYGAKEIHVRPACPPLVFGCKFLNFSRSRSEMDLAARRAIRELEGEETPDLEKYANPDTEQYNAMVDRIRQRMGVTTLRYQRLDDLVKAIGKKKESVCTYCWDGCDGRGCGK